MEMATGAGAFRAGEGALPHLSHAKAEAAATPSPALSATGVSVQAQRRLMTQSLRSTGATIDDYYYYYAPFVQNYLPSSWSTAPVLVTRSSQAPSPAIMSFLRTEQYGDGVTNE